MCEGIIFTWQEQYFSPHRKRVKEFFYWNTDFRSRTSISKVSEVTVSCQRKTIGFRHFGGKNKMEIEAVIEESENNPTSYVHEDQPTFEGEIYHGSSEQKLTDLQVVSVKEVRRIGHDRVKHSTVVAEGTKRADSEASDVVLSHFVGQHLNVLEDSEIQRLIDDNPVEFRTCWKEEKRRLEQRRLYLVTRQKKWRSWAMLQSWRPPLRHQLR